MSGRFLAFEQLPARSSGSQIQRIRGPWQSNGRRGSVAYLTLLRSERNAEQRRNGYADLNWPQRFAGVALNLLDLILRKVKLEKIRLYLIGKKGYVRIRRDEGAGPVPVIGTPGGRAAFFVK